MNDNTVKLNAEAAPAEPQSVTLERPARHIRQPFVHQNARLIVMLLFAAFGTAIGALLCGGGIACALTQSGDFAECFVTRLICSGSVLLFVYILGFFAAGGAVVWLAPIFSGLGAGLSLAAAYSGGITTLWVVPIAAMYPILTAFAAKSSSELSELIANLITSKKSSIIMSDSAALSYSLRFAAYLMILLMLSAAEAAVKG